MNRWLWWVCLLLLVEGDVEAKGQVPLTAIFSPWGELVGAQDEAAIYLWDRRSGKQRGKIPHAVPFRGSLTPGGLVAAGAKGLRVFSGGVFQHQTEVRLPPGVTVGRTAISQNGKVVAASFPGGGGAGDPDSVGVWNGRTGALRQRITLKQGRVQGLLLSRRGELLAIYGDDPVQGALLRVYRLKGTSARPIIRFTHRGDRTTYGAAFGPRDKMLALCSGRRLVLWDLVRRKITAQVETQALMPLFPIQLRKAGFNMPGAHGVAFSSNGKRLSTLHAFGVVGVGLWDVSRRKRKGRARELKPLRWINRPRKSGTLGQLAWDRGKLWLLTTDSGTVRLHTPHGDRFRQVRTFSLP